MGLSKERWLVGVFCPGSHHLLNTSIIIIGIVHAKIIPVLIAEKRIAGANTRMKRMENMPAIFFKERYAYSDLIMKRNCIVIPSMNKSYHIAVPRIFRQLVRPNDKVVLHDTAYASRLPMC